MGHFIGTLLLLIVATFTHTADAHTRSTSYSVWTIPDDPAAPIKVSYRVHPVDLTRLALHPDLTPEYADRVAAQLGTDIRPRDCTLLSMQAGSLQQEWLWSYANFQCPDHTRLQIQSLFLERQTPQHLHFVSLRWPDGRNDTHVLTASERNWTATAQPQIATSPAALHYLGVGIEHILSGWDHLAFLFGLVMLSSRLSGLIWLITGFTVAHSLSLAMSTFGLVQVSAHAVEIMIALSIVLVAVESAWQQMQHPASLITALLLSLVALGAAAYTGYIAVPSGAFLGLAVFAGGYFAAVQRSASPQRWRVLVSFAFGLFHGFGFAGVMMQLDLPAAELWQPLLGFNLGVELGQIALIALLWPLWRWSLPRWPQLSPALTAILLGLGTHWLVLRLV